MSSGIEARFTEALERLTSTMRLVRAGKFDGDVSFDRAMRAIENAPDLLREMRAHVSAKNKAARERARAAKRADPDAAANDSRIYEETAKANMRALAESNRHVQWPVEP
jgi:hypothetical protein